MTLRRVRVSLYPFEYHCNPGNMRFSLNKKIFKNTNTVNLVNLSLSYIWST